MVARELSRLVGAENVVEVPAASPYNSDASDAGGLRGLRGRAQAAVLPGSAEHAAEVVAWCYEHDVPVVPRGGGTGLVGGAVPSEGGVVVSMERLRTVRELEPGLWRMQAEAGVRTRDVQRLARESGLFFGPDPGAAEQSQLGGNVATNAGGPHALKYGVTGAWVTGLEVVLAPGELVSFGGWIRKDVAGYDLKDLMIGSEGTLGLITAVRLRLLPAPEAAGSLVAFLADRGEGVRAMLDLLAAGLRPSVLDFADGETLRLAGGSYPLSRAGGTDSRTGEAEGVPDGAGFALIVELDGTHEGVREQRAELVELLSGRVLAVQEPVEPQALWRWRDGINPAVTSARGAKVSADVVLPLDCIEEGLRRFELIASEHGLRSCAWGHGGEGNVHATVLVDPDSERELRAAEEVDEQLFGVVAELGGSIAGEHGVGLLKRGRLALQWDERAVAMHEAVKRAFDPKGLLNPGKKLAR